MLRRISSTRGSREGLHLDLREFLGHEPVSLGPPASDAVGDTTILAPVDDGNGTGGVRIVAAAARTTGNPAVVAVLAPVSSAVR